MGQEGRTTGTKEVEKMRKGLSIIVGVAILLFAFSTNADAALVAWWKLDDNTDSTTVIDSSGSNNTGTAQQKTDVMHTDSGNPPYLDGAFNFDDTNEYIDCGNTASLSNSTAKTVLMWVKALEHTGTSRYFYDDSYRASTYGDQMKLYGHKDELQIILKNTAGVYTHVDIEHPTNEWFMTGYSWDGTNVYFYMNGSNVASRALTGTLGNSTNLILGAMSGYLDSYLFFGQLDNVRIYDEALDSTDIETLYNGDMIPEPSALLLLGGGLLGLLVFRRKSKRVSF